MTEINISQRVLDDAQLDKLAPPTTQQEQAKLNTENTLYSPGQPYGWVICGGLLMYSPSLLALIFWLEFAPLIVLTFLAGVGGGLLGLGVLIKSPNKLIRSLLILGVGAGLIPMGMQYYHQPTQNIINQINHTKEVLQIKLHGSQR